MDKAKSFVYRNWTSFGAGLLLSLILLVAGIGKLLAQEEFAGVLVVQTFVGERLTNIGWSTYAVDSMLNIIGLTVPVLEVIIGGLLFIGFYPKLMAVLSLPLSLTFMANNVWLLTVLGLECPTCPHCFGKVEEIFGTLSTWQAIYLDITMVVLAAVVIILFPKGFFPPGLWFRRLKQSED